MKKPVVTLIIIGFMLATTSLAEAGRYRHYHHGHHYGHRYHGYHGHHSRHRHHNDYWVALGVGVVTGALITTLFYSPRTQTTVYSTPASTIVYPAPVVVQERRIVASTPIIASGKVTVSVGELNVRSGPGLSHSVIGSVRLGEMLHVVESSPGWYYVRTGAGRHGWVMTQYTRPASPVG